MVLGISISYTCLSDRRALEQSCRGCGAGVPQGQPPRGLLLQLLGQAWPTKEARTMPLQRKASRAPQVKPAPRKCLSPKLAFPLQQWSPTFLAPGTSFVEDGIFPRTWEGGVVSILPAGHLLLSSPVHNKLWTSTGLGIPALESTPGAGKPWPVHIRPSAFFGNSFSGTRLPPCVCKLVLLLPR